MRGGGHLFNRIPAWPWLGDGPPTEAEIAAEDAENAEQLRVISERLDRQISATAFAESLCEQYSEAQERAEIQRDELAQEIAAIRAVMTTVSVYEDLPDIGPLPVMVSELARDHEELEARIDAALHYLQSLLGLPPDSPASRISTIREVSRLLRGGARVPDTIEGLE